MDKINKNGEQILIFKKFVYLNEVWLKIDS